MVSPDPPSAKCSRLTRSAGAIATLALAAIDSDKKPEANSENQIQI